jgi:copper chaperone CopZ
VATVKYGVRGMTCGACVRHVQSALEAVPGVRSVQVDFQHASASMEVDGAVRFERLRGAVVAAGFTLVRVPRRNPLQVVLEKPLLTGPLAALALLGLYLGLITLAQGWDHALEQFDIDLWFVLALAAGFGTQVGLFTYLRALHARIAAGGVGMAASTGTSTAAMLACCAHHLSDVLPILGVSGAAVFLGAYQTPLLWVGLAMNLAGIAYLLWQIHGLHAKPGVSRGFRWVPWRASK